MPAVRGEMIQPTANWTTSITNEAVKGLNSFVFSMSTSARKTSTFLVLFLCVISFFFRWYQGRQIGRETEQLKMSTSARVACVWGANGISGLAMIDHLLEQPSSEWGKIICISRRPCQYEFDDRRVVFVSIDLLQSNVEEIVRVLDQVQGRTITDVFHYTYIEKKTEEELDEVNRSILTKALDVCAQLAGETLRSFSLQTGYKVHQWFTSHFRHRHCFSFLSVLWGPQRIGRARCASVPGRCATSSRSEFLFHPRRSRERIRGQISMAFDHHASVDNHWRSERLIDAEEQLCLIICPSREFHELCGDNRIVRQLTERIRSTLVVPW